MISPDYQGPDWQNGAAKRKYHIGIAGPHRERSLPTSNAHLATHLLRRRLLFLLDTTVWGRVWEIFDLLTNALLCAIYIAITTIVDPETKLPARVPTSLHVLEFMVALVFLSQYAIRHLLLAGRWFKVETALVLVSSLAPTIAFLVSLTRPSMRDSYMAAGAFCLVYPTRFYSLRYAMGRVLAAGPTNMLRLTILERQVVSLLFDIIVLVLTAASVVHSGLNWYEGVSPTGMKGFSFYDAVYFAALGALHESDAIPDNSFSRTVTLIIICIIAIFVPPRITKLIELVLQTSRYAKRSRLAPRSKHIILCGHLDYTSVLEFLLEFFSKDHGPGVWESTVVILHPTEPSTRIKELLESSSFVNRVSYVRGSPASFADLQKAHGGSASSIFILSQKLSYKEAREDDAGAVTAAMALSKFAKYYHWQEPNMHPKYRIYSQVLLPESVEHMDYLGVTQTMCVDECRMGILAQSCSTPGFATLIYMLSATVTKKDARDLLKTLSKQNPYPDKDQSWAEDYLEGVRQEIYDAPVPEPLVGKSFFKAARYFYRTFDILLFGVRTQSKQPHSKSNVGGKTSCAGPGYSILLCPYSHILQSGDLLFIITSDMGNVRNAMEGARLAHIKNATTSTYSSSISTQSTSSSSSSSDDSHIFPSIGAKPPRYACKSNYISESDSSSFSDPLSDMASGTYQEETTRSSPTPGVKRSVGRRIERVGRAFDNIPQNLNGHIVVCDASPRFPRNLPLLIQSLKSTYEDDLLPVVILSPAKAEKTKLRVIQDFANVFVIRGTPLSKPDLNRSLITKAKKAIILSNNKYYDAVGKNREMADSTTLLSALNIKSIRGDGCFVVSEIVISQNVQCLDHSQLIVQPILANAFVAGQAFLPSIMDRMISRSFYSPHIMGVLKHLIFSHTSSDKKHRTDSHAEDGSSRPGPWPSLEGKTGKFRLFQVPIYAVGHPYSKLALLLMRKHCSVPLGLYRLVSQGAREFPCVICNPRHNTIIQEGDAIYILGPRISGWREFGTCHKIGVMPGLDAMLENTNFQTTVIPRLNTSINPSPAGFANKSIRDPVTAKSPVSQSFRSAFINNENEMYNIPKA